MKITHLDEYISPNEKNIHLSQLSQLSEKETEIKIKKERKVKKIKTVKSINKNVKEKGTQYCASLISKKKLLIYK